MMGSNKLINVVERIFHIIYKGALLNMVFLMFVIRGGIVLGLFPSITTLLIVSKKYFDEESDLPLWKTYKKIFSEEFKSSNVVGLILTVGGLILYLNYQQLTIMKYRVPVTVIFCFYLIIGFYILLLVWIFPLLASHCNSIPNHLKNAFILSITQIHRTFFLCIAFTLIVYCSLSFPALIIFFTASVSSVVFNQLTRDAIEKVKVIPDRNIK